MPWYFYRKFFLKEVGEPEQKAEATWVTGMVSYSHFRFGHNRKMDLVRKCKSNKPFLLQVVPGHNVYHCKRIQTRIC